MRDESLSLTDEELAVLNTPTQGHRGTPQRIDRNVATDTVDPTLLELHRRYVDSLTTSLSAVTNRDVVAKLRDQGLGTYSQFVFGQPVPTCCAIVRAEPIELEFYLAVQPTILYPLIDRLLGCKHSDPIPQRPLTEIETALAEIILCDIMSKYGGMWQQAFSLEMRIERIEHNVQQLAALPGSEQTYRVRYGVTSGADHGQLEICLPWRATRQIRQRLAALR